MQNVPDTSMPRVIILLIAGLISSACDDSADTRTSLRADSDSQQADSAGQSETRSTRPTSVAPLEEMDWVIAGIEIGADSSDVRRILGDPRELVRSMHPYGSELELLEWLYPDLTVHLQGDGIVNGFTLTGPSLATRRGVSVGHDLETLNRAYGAPNEASSRRWLYCDPQYDECLRLIQFHVQGDRISSIWLGVPQD